MNVVLRVIKNSTLLSFAILLERGLSLILPLYVARILGKELWGYYTLALAFVTIASSFSFWGFGQLLPREVARKRENLGKYLANAGLIGGGMAVLTIIITLFIVYLLKYPPQLQKIIFWGVLFVLLPRTETTIIEAIINGIERMEWIIFVRLLSTALRIFFSIWLLLHGYGIETLFVVLALYHLVGIFLYLLIFQTTVPDFCILFDKKLFKYLFFQALPFVAIVATGETFKQMDRIILSKTWDAGVVGIYATGIMLVQMMYLIAPAIMNALFPGLSRTYLTSKERFDYLVSWLFKIIFIGIFPVSLTIVVFAEPLIQLLFGQGYIASVIVLQISALGIVPSFVARLLFRTLLASNNEKLALKASFVNGLVSLVMNVLLISRYGVIGASVSFMITPWVGLLQNLFYVSTRVVRFNFVKSLFVPMGCMFLSIFAYIMLHWNLFSIWITSFGIFLAAIFVSGTISRSDIENLNVI